MRKRRSFDLNPRPGWCTGLFAGTALVTLVLHQLLSQHELFRSHSRTNTWRGQSGRVSTVAGPCKLAAARPSLAAAPGAGRQPVDRIAVLGERHSGTNALTYLLRKNFDLTVSDGFTDHKHWMQPEPREKRDWSNVLILIMTKNLYDWTQGMHTDCWHCHYLELLPFPDFVQARVMSHENQRQIAKRPTYGRRHSSDDINLLTNENHFNNIIEMRQLKACQWLNLTFALDTDVEFVRAEDILYPHQQLELVATLASKYGLEAHPDRRDGFASYAYYKYDKDTGFDPDAEVGESLYYQGTAGRLNASQREAVAAVNRLADWNFEQALGYIPLQL